MPLVPIATYFGQDNAGAAIVFGPFTPTAGELWTIASCSWDTGNPTGVPAGGGQVYLPAVVAAPGGFNGYARLDTCVVAGSPGAMSVTVPAPAGNTRHSASLIRWPVGTTLDAVNAVVNGSGTPNSAVTTTSADDGVHQASVDVASQDPATRVFRNTAVELGVLDGHVNANSVQYHAYVADIGPAGTYAVGLTAPGSQLWVQVAVAVKAAAAPPPSGVIAERMAISQGTALWEIRQGSDDERASLGSFDWEITT